MIYMQVSSKRKTKLKALWMVLVFKKDFYFRIPEHLKDLKLRVSPETIMDTEPKTLKYAGINKLAVMPMVRVMRGNLFYFGYSLRLTQHRT